MIDYARIMVRAGDGGTGSGSFFRIKGKRYGKADGGDGGKGGNVYLEASPDLNTLEPFRYVKNYIAKNGANGLSRRRKGAEGEDLRVKVPVGTVAKIENLKLKIENLDLTEKGQKVLVARGGQGGRGNIHLRDQFGRRPKAGENGKTGEVCHLTLELKLIADVGLIGLPNSGKSTLLSVLTSARPKIAPYPFTTLEPNLGVIDNLKFKISNLKLVMADIPGLIEGASRGRGLGDLFLRHIERTKILLHLIDISTQSDKWQDYQTVRGELKAYSKELAKKQEIIVLTKIDLVTKEKVNQVLEFFKNKRKRVVAISAVADQGLELLVGEILKETKRQKGKE